MFVVQLYLPLRSNSGTPFPRSHFDAVNQRLTERFGGVTAYLRAPASGSWHDDRGEVKHDDIVVFEVLTESIDEQWWKGYRHSLESAFRQEEIVIRAHEVSIL